jgi:hypothetical protein
MRPADKLPMFGKRKSSSVLVGTASKQLKLVPKSLEQSKDPKKDLSKEPSKEPSKELSKGSKDLPSLDELALAAVVVSVVSAQHRRLLRDAVAQLDLSLFKPLKTQWGESKRLQATFGAEDCLIKRYNFSRLDNPILKATGNLLTLLEQAAQQLQAELKAVIIHVNYYPKGTAAGCAAHQDDEDCIDQEYPIIGYQVGGPATFHVWSGRPEGRPGASVVLDESQSYMMPAGFQLVNWHSVTRSKVGEKGVCRYNITFRVVRTH